MIYFFCNRLAQYSAKPYAAPSIVRVLTLHIFLTISFYFNLFSSLATGTGLWTSLEHPIITQHFYKTKGRFLPMSTNYETLVKSLSQPLPPGFETVSGKLPHTLLNDLMFRIVFESTPDGLKKRYSSLVPRKL